MSRLFDSTTDRITGGSVAMPATGSFSLWVYPTWAQTDNAAHQLFDVANDSTHVFRLEKWSTNAMHAGWYNAGEYRVIVASANYTLNQNAWNHICITWDDTANVTKLYLNGAQIGASTSTLVTFTTTGVRTLGNYSGGLGNLDAAARLAELGIWNVVLTLTEVQTLAAGNSSISVQPAALVDEWRLVGDVVSERGGALTDTTTAVAAHPSITDLRTLRRRRAA